MGTLPNRINVHDDKQHSKKKPRDLKILTNIARIMILIWGMIVIIMGFYIPILISTRYPGYNTDVFAIVLIIAVFMIIGILVIIFDVISFYSSGASSWTKSALTLGIVVSLILLEGVFIVGALGLVLCITAISLLILSKTQGVYNLEG